MKTSFFALTFPALVGLALSLLVLYALIRILVFLVGILFHVHTTGGRNG